MPPAVGSHNLVGGGEGADQSGVASSSAPSSESGVDSGVSSDELPELIATTSAFVTDLIRQQQQQLNTSELRNHLAYAEERCSELEGILANYQQEAADRYGWVGPYSN